MVAAKLATKPTKTSTVKITRLLADAISLACKADRVEPSVRFGPALEAWVKRLYLSALKKAGAGKIAEISQGESPRRDATLRMPRSVVKRLGIVSSITGVSVSEMLETKLWEILGTK